MGTEAVGLGEIGQRAWRVRRDVSRSPSGKGQGGGAVALTGQPGAGERQAGRGAGVSGPGHGEEMRGWMSPASRVAETRLRSVHGGAENRGHGQAVPEHLTGLWGPERDGWSGEQGCSGARPSTAWQ